VKKIDKIRRIAEIRSIKLSTSPVKTKKPFIKRSPAQNKMSCRNGFMPNISIKNTTAEIRSIPPRTFTANDIEISF